MYFFLVLILILSNGASFHSEVHTSLSEMVGTNFVLLTIGISYKSIRLILRQHFSLDFNFIWS